MKLLSSLLLLFTSPVARWIFKRNSKQRGEKKQRARSILSISIAQLSHSFTYRKHILRTTNYKPARYNIIVNINQKLKSTEKKDCGLYAPLDSCLDNVEAAHRTELACHVIHFSLSYEIKFVKRQIATTSLLLTQLFVTRPDVHLVTFVILIKSHKVTQYLWPAMIIIDAFSCMKFRALQQPQVELRRSVWWWLLPKMLWGAVSLMGTWLWF